MKSERRLAAIMFTDIVGYTTLMGQDQNKAYALLKENRQLQKPIIESCNGRWIKELGDGVLASFQTVSDAVNAAIRIQEECNAAHDFQLRIGIHQGEVIFENEDVFGDGVNIASRIESLGVPGSVLLSRSVRDQIRNNPDFSLVSLGAFDFKNVAEPVEVFALANPGLVVPKQEEIRAVPGSERKRSGIYKWLLALLLIAVAVFAILYFTGQEGSATGLPDKSIAVLPFVNMSDDPEQEYFSNGLSEELINVLAKTPQLKVIGRTSSFAFKGRNEDLREIGQMLDVSYLVEGSVRKAGDVLRITVQLINAADGSHLYAETFDRKLEDVFAIQDEISLDILDAVKIELFGAEKHDVLKRYTDNVKAYELFLNGRFHVNKFFPDAFLKAIEYFDAAIALDPTYAIAYSEKAFCYMNLRDYGWMSSKESMARALEAAHRSMELDDQIAESYLAAGRIKLHWHWNPSGAADDFRKAIAINPNSAQAYVQLGFCRAFSGDAEEAMEYAAIAESLDPFSLLNLWYLTGIFSAFDYYDKVMANGKKLIDLEPNYFGGYMYTALASMHQKNYQEAISALELAVSLNRSMFTLGYLAFGYSVSGDPAKAQEIVANMVSMESAHETANAYLGIAYLAIGEIDRAYQYFERAIEDREAIMPWVRYQLQAFIEDPQILELFDRIDRIFASH